ncbi:hypothetical protein LOK74_09290 [Brevibacillus humidisoli]|uniref:hypothetical protein n=1 Tax=Brevibacillus humidisoli TaxID=2895522 RepID=UPI001E47CD60|nr:hypothetical protein [Brevibacillus humidisoli]UFJ42663.1 hypothetical protein LOK74_09290 [Brevibacillus humidisoli]
MMIRCNRVDRYVFDAYFRSSRVAREWMEEAKLRAAWFERELLADFFLCFYLEKPQIDETAEATPFHRWIVRSLMKQYFYQMIHPRTIGHESAAFKTAIKALMWLSETYAAETKRREQEAAPMLTGIQSKTGQADDTGTMVSQHLTENQIERLRLVGYTLQHGKRVVEEKQEARDTRPLVEAEIRSLKEKIETLQMEMRTQYTKRAKLQQKAKKWQDELEQREKQRERLLKQEKQVMQELETELGQWLEQSLRQTLSDEAEESLFVQELIEASLRFASPRWGTELGRLRRQQLEKYLEWVNKLKKHPELLQFLQEVGRNVHHFRLKRRERRSRELPEEYYDLRQSGDISHLLPSEAVLLADPDYEYYFALKWLEQKLLTYDTLGWVEQPPKGPVICMLDTSHSMRGGKLRLAQIFVMTFAAICLLERRDFLLLLFGAKGELREQQLYYKRPDWQAFYDLARMAYGGGTHFDAPIKRGIQLIGENRSFQAADFVMVTDGIGRISPSVQDELAGLAIDKQIRLFTLLIGSVRQHLAHSYDILGVSHQIRFAASWETQEEPNTQLLLDVFQ